jgi:hypothetical protein
MFSSISVYNVYPVFKLILKIGNKVCISIFNMRFWDSDVDEFFENINYTVRYSRGPP